MITEETRERLRKSHLGHKVSAETKEKLSKSVREQWKTGKRKKFGPMSQKHKDNIRNGLNNVRDKIVASHLGNIPWNKGLKGFMSGEKHYNWKGGITPLNRKYRNSVDFKLWRESVFSRDNYTCQKCNHYGGYLHPHHIFNFATNKDLRFAIDNGITLCKSCHKEFHHKYGIKNNTKEQLNEFLNL